MMWGGSGWAVGGELMGFVSFKGYSFTGEGS